MAEEIITTGIDQKKLRPFIEKIKAKIKKSNVIKDMFKQYKIDLSELDLIPMCFAKIPVSARTDHGVIYLNVDLAKDDDSILDEDHYIVHEITHYLQQTTGSKPTPGSDDEDYLDNPVEEEGFNNQTKYISETKGDLAAEEYVDDLLDYHELKGKKKEEKFDDLLDLAQVNKHRIRNFGFELGLKLGQLFPDDGDLGTPSTPEEELAKEQPPIKLDTTPVQQGPTLIPEIKPPFQIDTQSQGKMNQLDSRFKPMVQKFLEDAYDKGIYLRIVQGYRSHQEQQSLYEQGRTKPGTVVTNAKPGVSLHNYGLAVDCVPIEDGKIIWNKPENFWNDLGNIAQSIGMVWGGNFSGLKDNDHFQYPITYSDIVSGKFRPEKN